MIKRTPGVPGSSPPLFLTGYLYILCVAGGLIAAILTFLLLTYASHAERLGKARDFSLQSLSGARSSMETTWDRAEFWADQMAWQLGAAGQESIPTLLARHQRLWPNIGFALFDANANPVANLTSEQPGLATGSIADQPVARAMVLKALDGGASRDFTIYRGFLSLGVAVPVQGKRVRVLVLSVPLDRLYLEQVKRSANADIAVAMLDDSGHSILGDMSNSGNTFESNAAVPSTLWTELNGLLRKTGLTGSTPFLLRDGEFFAGLELLVNHKGTPVGLLLASPHYTMPSGYHIWHVYASLIFGILAAALLAACLKFRERRMANAIAADIYGLARDMEAEPQNNWPPALSSAFRKMAESLEEYRVLLENALMQSPDKGGQEKATDAAGQAACEAEYQRLFDALPVGAFRTDRQGRFLKVNSAFAMLLGYESPMNFVAECGTFDSICLYGEGLRNPLAVIAAKGSGRHVISLRRRDGQVRHFAVICTALTSETGDDAGILEGFLIDREMEDKLTSCERQNLYSRQERESLARLLAATCLQTQSYFQPPKPKLPERDGDTAAIPGRDAGEKDGRAEAAPTPAWPEFKVLAGRPEGIADTPEDEERMERRKSVLSIKAILNDIYHIAMTEAEGSSAVPVPMELLTFLKQLCRQALPGLMARGISLRCEIADNLPLRMSGPAPILRHALLRCLMNVTAPARGGCASLNVMNDPNAPSSAGVSRLLFSVSWNSGEPRNSPLPDTTENGSRGHDSGKGSGDAQAPEGFTIFIAEAETAPPDKAGKRSADTLDLPSEENVLRFLARKMRGDLLDGVFTDTFRSLQLVVPLDHLCDVTDDCRTVAWEKSEQGTVDLSLDAESGAMPKAEPAEQQVEIRRVEREVPAADMARKDLAGLELEGETDAGSRPTSLDVLIVDPDDTIRAPGPARILAKDEILESENRIPMPSLDILLIDASLNNRMLFSMYLKDTTHRITEAHDGQEGVEAFQRGTFDVIFMDMEMPLMDGYQATRIIRALEGDNNLPATPIVGMTSYALPELRRECMLSGCTEFLSRPFGKNALLTMLRAFARLKNDDRAS